MRKLYDFRSSAFFIVAVVCISVFTDNLAYGIIIPVLPTVLLENAGVPETEVQSWVSYMLALYGATLLVFSPIFGYMSDRYWNRSTALLAGLPAMAASLVLFMACSSYPRAMAAARALQGISSAAVGVGSLALILDTVGPHNAAIGVSFNVVSIFLSAAVAPILGGILYDNFGYHAVFAVPANLLCLDVLLLLLIKQKNDDDTQRRFSISVIDNAHRDRRSMSTSSSSPRPTEHSALLSSANKDTDSVLLEHQQVSALSLLKDPRMLNAIVVVILCSAIFAAFETTLPLFLLRRFSWSPTKTGLLFLACSLPKALSPVAGKFIDLWGARYPTAIAMVVSSICLICLRVVQSDTHNQRMALFLFLATNNLATALIETAMIAEIGIVAGSKDLAAQGGAVVNIALSGGLMMGPILAGFVFQQFGWQGLTLALGLIWIVSLPVVLAFAGRK